MDKTERQLRQYCKDKGIEVIDLPSPSIGQMVIYRIKLFLRAVWEYWWEGEKIRR